MNPVKHSQEHKYVKNNKRREERMYKHFINSMGLKLFNKPVHVVNLYKDISDGLILALCLNAIEPNCNIMDLIKMKLENNNY